MYKTFCTHNMCIIFFKQNDCRPWGRSFDLSCNCLCGLLLVIMVRFRLSYVFDSFMLTCIMIHEILCYITLHSSHYIMCCYGCVAIIVMFLLRLWRMTRTYCLREASLRESAVAFARARHRLGWSGAVLPRRLPLVAKADHMPQSTLL